MRETRRLLLILSSVVGTWVLGSFAGAMLNPANAAFWSGSLMWSLLAALLVAPALLMIIHASSQARSAKPALGRQAPSEEVPTEESLAEEVSSEKSPAEESPSEASSEEVPTPFAGEERLHRLWPEGSQKAAQTAAETAAQTGAGTPDETPGETGGADEWPHVREGTLA